MKDLPFPDGVRKKMKYTIIIQQKSEKIKGILQKSGVFL